MSVDRKLEYIASKGTFFDEELSADVFRSADETSTRERIGNGDVD